ncbi:MAG: MFS transporter, partial [Candidatus Dormiibacterota bacterium]
GGAESLAQPARLAGAVVLAPPGAVERANSLMMVSFSIAQAVGFAVAGTLLTLSRNATYVYWIDSATFLAAALLALTLPSLGGGIKTALVRASGLKQLARAALRPLLLMTAGTNLLIGVGTSTMLPLAYSLYRQGAAAYTWLEVALIVGLVAGSLLISRWGLFGPETAMTIAVVVFGLAALGIAATSLLAVALVSIAITGVANAVYSVRNRAALMRKAGPDEQGSVMSTRYSTAQGSQIVGLGIGALIVQYGGPRTSFLAVGLGMLAVGGLFSLHRLRQPADEPVVEQGR